MLTAGSSKQLCLEEYWTDYEEAETVGHASGEGMVWLLFVMMLMAAVCRWYQGKREERTIIHRWTSNPLRTMCVGFSTKTTQTKTTISKRRRRVQKKLRRRGTSWSRQMLASRSRKRQSRSAQTASLHKRVTQKTGGARRRPAAWKRLQLQRGSLRRATRAMGYRHEPTPLPLPPMSRKEKIDERWVAALDQKQKIDERWAVAKSRLKTRKHQAGRPASIKWMLLLLVALAGIGLGMAAEEGGRQASDQQTSTGVWWAMLPATLMAAIAMGKRHQRRVELPKEKRRMISQAGTTVEVFMGEDQGWVLGLVTETEACGIRDTEELYQVQLLQGEHHGTVLREVDRSTIRIANRQVLPDIEAPAQAEEEQASAMPQVKEELHASVPGGYTPQVEEGLTAVEERALNELRSLHSQQGIETDMVDGEIIMQRGSPWTPTQLRPTTAQAEAEQAEASHKAAAVSMLAKMAATNEEALDIREQIRAAVAAKPKQVGANLWPGAPVPLTKVQKEAVMLFVEDKLLGENVGDEITTELPIQKKTEIDGMRTLFKNKSLGLEKRYKGHGHDLLWAAIAEMKESGYNVTAHRKENGPRGEERLGWAAEAQHRSGWAVQPGHTLQERHQLWPLAEKVARQLQKLESIQTEDADDSDDDDPPPLVVRRRHVSELARSFSTTSGAGANHLVRAALMLLAKEGDLSGHMDWEGKENWDLDATTEAVRRGLISEAQATELLHWWRYEMEDLNDEDDDTMEEVEEEAPTPKKQPQLARRPQVTAQAAGLERDKVYYVISYFSGWQSDRAIAAALRRTSGLKIKYISVDIRHQFLYKGKRVRTTLAMDLLQLPPQLWLKTVCERMGIEESQVLWTTYGIPCQTFTHAQDGNRGEKRLEGCAEGHAYRDADGEPIDKAARANGQHGDLPQTVKKKAAVARQHDKLARAVVQCIQSLPEGIVWLVENPRAHLRKRPYFKKMAPFEYTVNYCCFSGNTAKPTNIWTNAKWKPKGITQTGKQRDGRCLKDNRCTQGSRGKRLQDWKHPWGIAGAGQQPLVQMEPGEGQRLKNEVPKPLLAQVARASWRHGFTTGMTKLAQKAMRWQMAAAAVVTAEATHTSGAQDAVGSTPLLMAACLGLVLTTSIVWACWGRGKGASTTTARRKRHPRQGTRKNRYLVGQTACSHLRLLLLAMLAWGVDAAGTQQEGLSGQAVAAAAAAGMWIGHSMEAALPQHRMRIGCINVDGLAAEGAADQSRLWAEMHSKGATLLAIQDHRRREEYQRRQTESDARSIWQEGAQRFWHWQEPMAQPPHGSIGGTALAATGSTARIADKRIPDRRGWGRYSGVVLKSGGTKLLVVSVYMPCRSTKPGSLWQRQKELLQREGESTTDPWKAALNDVMREVDEADDGTEVLLMGDFNVPWDAGGRASGSMDSDEKDRLKFLQRECDRKQLCSLWHELHEEEVWTQWEKPGEKKGRSHIDHVLATPGAMQLRPKMAVLQEDQLCHSRHRLLMLELDSGWVAGAARQRGKRPAGPALKLDNKQSIKKFLSKAVQTFPQRAFKDLEEMEQMATTGSNQPELHKMVKSWSTHLGTLVQCELDMRKEQDCRSRRKKDGWSRSLVRLGKAQRAVLLGLRAGEHGKYGRARALRQQAASHMPSNLTNQLAIAPIRDGGEKWHEWTSGAQKVHKELLLRMHGSRRKKARLKASTWARQKEQMYKLGRCKQQLARDLGRPRRQGLPREVEDDDGSLHTDPAAVKGALRKAFLEWFGAGRSKWFVGKRLWGTAGKETRKWIADAVPQMQTGETEQDWYDKLPEWVKPAIAEAPQRCWKVIRAAKRKKGSKGQCITAKCNTVLDKENLFSNQRWEMLWSRKKGGTAPGKSGLTTTIMKALLCGVEPAAPDDCMEYPGAAISDAVRRWCNLVFKEDCYPEEWGTSLLVPIPKKEGTKKATEHRPLCMMEVVRNACIGDIFRRISSVWRELEAVDEAQYAFQEGKGVEGPLKLATAVAEDAFLYRKQFCRISQDISKAFDKVERTLGKEMGLRRMGVPEWVIGVVAKLDASSTLYVCTGHGESDAIHPETGWPQGSEEGPQGWVAHYDWMIQLQKEAKHRDPYIVEDCGLDTKTEGASGTTEEEANNWAKMNNDWGIQVFGGVFADDSLWFSRTPSGAQVAAETAEDFLGFHGGQFNVDKSSFIMIKWSQKCTDSEARDWEEIEWQITVEKVEPDSDGNTVSMTMRRLDGNTPERYLGVDMTGTVWWGEVEASMEAAVKTIAACCRKAKVRRYGARALLQAVAQPKANHSLKWASSSQERLREIWRPAEIAMKAAVRLAVSTPAAVAQAVSGPMDHGTRHEQIMALMQLLLRKDLAGSLARNEVARLQLMCGRAVPVMSSTEGAALRQAWRGDWLGRVWSWMASMHITIDGGSAIQPACTEDVVLVEAAMGTAYEEQVAEACWQWEVYTMADLTLADGETLRPEARMGGAWMQQHEHNWLKWVATFTGSTHKLDDPLTGARGGTGWHRRGRTVAWTHDKAVKLGRLIGVSGKWAAIQEWTEVEGNTRLRSSSRTGSGGAQLLRKGDRWCENIGGGRKSAAPLHCIFPVDMNNEGPHDGHRQVWTCVSSAEWLESYMTAAPPLQQEIDERWVGPAEGLEEGLRHSAMHEQMARDEGKWQEKALAGAIQMGQVESSPAILRKVLALSDGSTWHAGTSQATTTFGWVMRPPTGVAHGDYGIIAAGMGLVEGAPAAATSTRAEAAGVLSAMRATRRRMQEEEWVRPLEVDHALDNESVVKVYWNMPHWPALRWLRAADRDIWRAIQAEVQELERVGVTYSLRWTRSHPERRLALEAWAEEDVLNHMADRYAERAQHRHRSTTTGLDWAEVLPPTGGSMDWGISILGTQVTGNVRAALKEHSRFYPLEQRLTEKFGDFDKAPFRAHMQSLSGPLLIFVLKLMANLLPTEVVLVVRGHGTALLEDEGGLGHTPSTCKLCGEADETNMHAILHCTGDLLQVQERIQLVAEVHRTLLKAMPGSAAILDMLVRTKEGKVVDFGSEEEWDQVCGNTALAGDLQAALREHHGWEGMLRGGASTKLRRVLMERGGLQPEEALQLAKKIMSVVAKGGHDVWRARCTARAEKVGGASRQLLQQVEERLQWLQERGCHVDGQAAHLKRLTNRKQREWLKKTQEGQTTLHGKYRGDEDHSVLAARRKANEDRREARAKAALAEAPQRKKQRQTTITWARIERISAEAANGQLVAALQVPAAESGRLRQATESEGQQQITARTTVRERTENKHAKRKAKSTRGTRRRSGRRKTVNKRGGAGARDGGRDGVAALSQSTMREKD